MALLLGLPPLVGPPLPPWDLFACLNCLPPVEGPGWASRFGRLLRFCRRLFTPNWAVVNRSIVTAHFFLSAVTVSVRTRLATVVMADSASLKASVSPPIASFKAAFASLVAFW